MNSETRRYWRLVMGPTIAKVDGIYDFAADNPSDNPFHGLGERPADNHGTTVPAPAVMPRSFDTSFKESRLGEA
jgi:hypothetical protein